MSKNVSQMRSSTDLISHNAVAPEFHPRGDAKTTARMMKSSFDMFPKEKDMDTFTSPAKRTNASRSQFTTSEQLYGNEYGCEPPRRQPMKKMTPAKRAELCGSSPAKPLTQSQLNVQLASR